jgi:uncharacterized protein YdhG (YjbR/CyaY superfamily)
MWRCPDCGRDFKIDGQHHFCGELETIDQYIDEQDEKIRPLLLRVRAAVRAAAPEAKEKIAWQMPAFWQGENLIYFAAAKNHLGIYPGDLTDLPFKERLEGYQTSKGTIRFPYDNIDFDLITDIVKWRLERVKAKRYAGKGKG